MSPCLINEKNHLRPDKYFDEDKLSSAHYSKPLLQSHSSSMALCTIFITVLYLLIIILPTCPITPLFTVPQFLV